MANSFDTSLLQELGLSPNEAKVYSSLLTYGGAGVSSIALRAGVHRRNTYDTMHRLLEKGLVFEDHSRGEVLYHPVDPEKLMELVREKEMKLASALPAYRDLFRTKRVPERALIFRGVEGVKNYMREALDCGQDMYTLGAEGAWLDPRIATYTTWFMREAKARKMKIHALLDYDAIDLKDAHALAHEYKFLPEPYDTSATMDIFGDYVVTYTGTAPGRLMDDATIFVMHSPELAASYRVWWQLLWDLLPDAAAQKKTTKKKRR